MGKNRRKEAGFSLVEVLISFLLLIILLGPLLSFMRAGQIGRSTSLRISDVEQNARAAMISIGRDLQNAGYNFAPQVPLDNSPILSTLLGNPAPASRFLTPIIPGNNLNLVRTVNSSGATVTNQTDQITLIFVDQSLNNGLPMSGNVPAPPGTPSTTNDQYTITSAIPSTGLGLYPGDFVVLSMNGQFAVGSITSITGVNGNTVLRFGPDPYGVNQSGSGPAIFSSLGQQKGEVGLYKFFFITYFVDGNGNLIRREQLPPPHSAQGGNNTATAAIITANTTTYTCAGTCYIDNIIATGVEDLQFTYYLADPTGTGVTGPLDPQGNDLDPGPLGSQTNRGNPPSYRLLDIRQVNVSIKVRASERDTKIHDLYNKNQGYLYRFTLQGTFNTRNFYGSDFRQS